MELKEQYYSVLLVSATEKFNESLLSLLKKRTYDPVTVVTSNAAARRTLLENHFDIVIINTPLPDDFGAALALDVCASSASGVMLLVKAEHYSEISARCAPYGVLTVSKPTNSPVITQTLQLLCATRQRLRAMEKKTASIEEKMEEIRIVNRAKWLLIEQLKMTESEAHRYIEKLAMDRCTTKRSVAEAILSTYT